MKPSGGEPRLHVMQTNASSLADATHDGQAIGSTSWRPFTRRLFATTTRWCLLPVDGCGITCSVVCRYVFILTERSNLRTFPPQNSDQESFEPSWTFSCCLLESFRPLLLVRCRQLVPRSRTVPKLFTLPPPPLSLCTPETKSFVGQMFQRWRPQAEPHGWLSVLVREPQSWIHWRVCRIPLKELPRGQRTLTRELKSAQPPTTSQVPISCSHVDDVLSPYRSWEGV